MAWRPERAWHHLLGFYRQATSVADRASAGNSLVRLLAAMARLSPQATCASALHAVCYLLFSSNLLASRSLARLLEERRMAGLSRLLLPAPRHLAYRSLQRLPLHARCVPTRIATLPASALLNSAPSASAALPRQTKAATAATPAPPAAGITACLEADAYITRLHTGENCGRRGVGVRHVPRTRFHAAFS